MGVESSFLKMDSYFAAYAASQPSQCEMTGLLKFSQSVDFKEFLSIFSALRIPGGRY
jgi:hypothetical protein